MPSSWAYEEYLIKENKPGRPMAVRMRSSHFRQGHLEMNLEHPPVPNNTDWKRQPIKALTIENDLTQPKLTVVKVKVYGVTKFGTLEADWGSSAMWC